MFLKGAATASVSSPNAAPAAEKKGKGASKPAAVPPLVPAPPKATVPGYKTCVVCQLMNINTQVSTNELLELSTDFIEIECMVYSPCKKKKKLLGL